MKIATWKNSSGILVSSITSTGIYYPVGPLGAFKLKCSMAVAGQTASLEVVTLDGANKGILGISVSGTAQSVAIATPGNVAILNSDIGVKVTAISGSLVLLLDDEKGAITTSKGVVGTLAEILALTSSTVAVGSLARPTDVQGCTLEMSASGWVGCLGVLTSAQFAALSLANMSTNGWDYLMGEDGAVISNALGSAANPYSSITDLYAAYANTPPSKNKTVFVKTTEYIWKSFPSGISQWVVLSPVSFRTNIIDIAFFGDSQSQIGYPDVSVYPATSVQVASPASNQTRYRRPNSSQVGYRIVCDFGIAGQTTTQMLARTTMPRSTTRRAVSDLASAGVKAVFFVGMSVNDFSDTANDAYYDQIIYRHAKLVKIITDYGIRVYDPGMIGYSVGDYATYPSRVLYCNTGLEKYPSLVNNPLYTFVSMKNLLHDSTGTFIPGVSYDGKHLSPYGEAVLSDCLEAAANNDFGVYSGNRGLPEINDWQNDINSSANGLPANITEWFRTACNIPTVNTTVTEDSNGDMVWEFFAIPTANNFTITFISGNYTIPANTPVVLEVDFALFLDGAPSPYLNLETWIGSGTTNSMAYMRQENSVPPYKSRRKIVTIPIIFDAQTTCEIILAINPNSPTVAGIPTFPSIVGRTVSAKIYNARLLNATNF